MKPGATSSPPPAVGPHLVAFLVGAVTGLFAFVSVWWQATGGVPGPDPLNSYKVLLFLEVPVIIWMGLVPLGVVRLLGRRLWPSWATPMASFFYGLVWYPLWWVSFMLGRPLWWEPRGAAPDAALRLLFLWGLPAVVASLLIWASYRVMRWSRGAPR